MRITHRMQSQPFPPSSLAQLREWVAAQPGTLSLTRGVVSFAPPPEAIAAVSPLPDDPDLHRYQPVLGSPALIELAARKVEREGGLSMAGRRVIITAGSNQAFLSTLLAVTDPGDEVILPSPYFFDHDMAVRVAGCRPVHVPVDARYQLDPDAVRRAITDRTRAVLTVSPNNPTGAVYPEETLRAVNALCGERDLCHVSDEAYEYFVYDRARHFSPASIAGSAPHTVAMYSMSKSYGMASWRIGYAVVPERLIEPLLNIQDASVICPPQVCQLAAIGALSTGADYCRREITDIDRQRQLLLEALRPLGDRCDPVVAQGAFFLLLRLRCALTGSELVRRLISEHRVAVVPGEIFGAAPDECRIRVSYGSLSGETAAEAVRRFVRGLDALVR